MFIYEQKENGEKEAISAHEMQYRLEGSVKNSALAIQQMIEGAKLQTDWAYCYYDFNAH